MNQNEKKLSLNIEGYNPEEISLAAQEINNGTSREDLQTLFYKKFGFMDYQSDDLILKIKAKQKNKFSNQFKAKDEKLDSMILEKSASTTIPKIIIEKIISTANKHLVWGIVIFALGLIITFATKGQSIYIGVILIGFAKIIKGIVDLIKYSKYQ